MMLFKDPTFKGFKPGQIEGEAPMDDVTYMGVGLNGLKRLWDQARGTEDWHQIRLLFDGHRSYITTDMFGGIHFDYRIED